MITWLSTRSAKRQILAGSNWLGGGNLAMRLMQVLLLLLVLRFEQPKSYGGFALASAIVAIATYCAEGGLIQASVSTPALTIQQERSLAKLAVRLSTLIYLVAVFAGWLIGQWSNDSTVFPYTSLMASTVVPAALGALSIGRLQKLGRYRSIAVWQMWAGLISLACCAPFLLAEDKIWALVVQSWSSSLAYSALCFLGISPRIWPAGQTVSVNEVSKAARYALVSNLVGVSGRRSDDLLIGGALGPAAVGQYGVAYRFLTVATEVLLQPSERVALTSLAAKVAEDRGAGLRLAQGMQKRLVIKAMPLFVLLAILVYLFTVPVIGSQWEEAAQAGFFLCLAGSIQSSYWLTYSILFVLISPRQGLLFQAALAMCFIGGAAAGLPFGVVGCAVGYLLGSIVAGVIAFVMKRHLRVVGTRSI